MRTLTVWYKDLARWDVKSFTAARWQWPREVIHPLAHVLHRKVVPVDRKGHRFEDLRLITLHFDGSMEPRDLRGRKKFKGRLFFADTGDVLYSKIDVRNGAIGVVPDNLGRVVVSSEYPIYAVDGTRLLAPYVQLLFRASFLREKINGMVSGTSGRKRVNPDELEAIEIPVPPLEVQRAIIEYHRRAQEEARNAQDEANHLEQEISRYILKRLGISTGEVQRIRGPFMVWSKDLKRWSVEFNGRTLQASSEVPSGKYPIHLLGEFVESSRNGISVRPTLETTTYKILKLNAISESGLDALQTKYVPISERDASRFAMRKGDLLICRSVGSFDLIAKACVVDADVVNVVYPDIIIRVRLRPGIDVHFVREVMQTAFGRQQFQARARTAVGMWKIGAEDIRAFELPVPPSTVQQEIVAYVKELRDGITALREGARQILESASREVEEMILGIRPVQKALA